MEGGGNPVPPLEWGNLNEIDRSALAFGKYFLISAYFNQFPVRSSTRTNFTSLLILLNSCTIDMKVYSSSDPLSARSLGDAGSGGSERNSLTRGKEEHFFIFHLLGQPAIHFVN